MNRAVIGASLVSAFLTCAVVTMVHLAMGGGFDPFPTFAGWIAAATFLVSVFALGCN